MTTTTNETQEQFALVALFLGKARAALQAAIENLDRLAEGAEGQDPTQITTEQIARDTATELEPMVGSVRAAHLWAATMAAKLANEQGDAT